MWNLWKHRAQERGGKGGRCQGLGTLVSTCSLDMALWRKVPMGPQVVLGTVLSLVRVARGPCLGGQGLGAVRGAFTRTAGEKRCRGDPKWLGYTGGEAWQRIVLTVQLGRGPAEEAGEKGRATGRGRGRGGQQWYRASRAQRD